MQTYSEPKLAELYSLYLRGCPLKEICSRYGIPTTTLIDRFKREGMQLRGKPVLDCQYFNGIKFSLRVDGYYARTNGNREKMHRYVWRYHFGKIPRGYDVHHINGDKTDNRIKNLECISKSEHTQKYSSGSNQFQKKERKGSLV